MNSVPSLKKRTGRQLLDLDANRGARHERHRTRKGTERPIAVSRAKPRDVVHRLVLQLPPAAGVDDGVEEVNAAESQEEAFGQGREGVVGFEAGVRAANSASKVVSKGGGAGRYRQGVLWPAQSCSRPTRPRTSLRC